MTRAARSLFVFGVYAIVAGIALLVLPGVVLATLRFPPAQDGWVRVVGALAIFVGAYHVLGARKDLVPYIRATVWGRIGFAMVLAGLVVVGLMPSPLLLFALVDLAGAVWTGLALRRSSTPVPAA